MTKFSKTKPSLAIAVLLFLVAIATLQSVAAPNQPQQVSPTATETITQTNTVGLRYHAHGNSSEIQALADYGVVRLQTTATGEGSTINIGLNSTVGPIYLEQLQISLSTQQSSAIGGASLLTIGGLNGPTCTGTIIPAGQLYGDFLPTCPSTAKITDPVGNPAIAANAGTSNAWSMEAAASDASQISGQVSIMALVCAPVTAEVTLTANLQ